LRKLRHHGDDITSLKDLLISSLKGAAAYAYHARALGKESEDIYAGVHEGLSFLAEKKPSVEEAFRMCLRSGELNLKAMEQLDAANTGAYGHPQPTHVRVTPVKGKAILVSGHDLKDLEAMLKQTECTGINVYTHGEMLPAHGYPKLKQYKHLVGNYGGAWQKQSEEFDAFPGAILMTTNCIQKPRESYKARIFTSDLVAWPGVEHVSRDNYGQVVRAALSAPGFAEKGPDKQILVGFGHQAVLGVADKVIDAVKSGAIRHFFLIGGCDGAKGERSYYTELARSVPKNCVILTLACGKYRFNKLDFGEIDAFDCSVNDLPLSLILSWYEQKAAAILMTLLHLGIKNIRLGPSLPAFISPNVLRILVEEYNVMPISTPREDLIAILGEEAMEEAA
jgi:hydroxylamine reductase